MQKTTPPSPDKTIVQRKAAHEGDMSRKAVRNLRDGLTKNTSKDKTTSNHFGAEVLLRHAKLQKILIPIYFVISAVVFFAQNIVSQTLAGIWLGVVALLTLASVYVANRYERSLTQSMKFTKWSALLQGSTLLRGLLWVVPFAIYPLQNAPSEVSALFVSATLVVMALAFASSRYLKYGVLLGALP